MPVRAVGIDWRDVRESPESEPGSFVSASLIADDYAIVATCIQSNRGGRSAIWYSTDLAVWEDTGLKGSERCVKQIEATPFGILALDNRVLFSVDGTSFAELVDPGLDSAGWPSALFVAPGAGRVTYLGHTVGLGESQVPHMFSTVDGVEWTADSDETAAQFNGGGPVRVIHGGDGLLGIGITAGEGIPDARILTSADGLKWRTLETGPNRFNKALSDVLFNEGTFVTVGGDFFGNGLMASWISEDGLHWESNPQPADETVDPNVGQVTATDVTTTTDGYLAAGRDFSARRTGAHREFAAFWESADGREWTRTEEPLSGPITPFVLGSNSRGRLAAWPPAGSGIEEPLRLFVQPSTSTITDDQRVFGAWTVRSATKNGVDVPIEPDEELGVELSRLGIITGSGPCEYQSGSFVFPAGTLFLDTLVAASECTAQGAEDILRNHLLSDTVQVEFDETGMKWDSFETSLTFERRK